MKKVKISPLSLIWFTFLLFSKTPFILPMICAIILHELGHILSAFILKIKIQSFELSILGARITTKESLSYIDELLFSLGGPLMGIIGFIFTLSPSLNYADFPICQDFLFPFSILSLCLSIFNLIPLPSLDGGRILKCLVCLIFSLPTADKILHFTYFLTLLCLWMLSVYMMLKTSNGVPMFIFCLIFFSKCFICKAQNGDLARF